MTTPAPPRTNPGPYPYQRGYWGFSRILLVAGCMSQADMATGDLDADAPIDITRRPVGAYLDSHSTIVAPDVPSSPSGSCRHRAVTVPPVRTARASHGPPATRIRHRRAKRPSTLPLWLVTTS